MNLDRRLKLNLVALSLFFSQGLFAVVQDSERYTLVGKIEGKGGVAILEDATSKKRLTVKKGEPLKGDPQTKVVAIEKDEVTLSDGFSTTRVKRDPWAKSDKTEVAASTETFDFDANFDSNVGSFEPPAAVTYPPSYNDPSVVPTMPPPYTTDYTDPNSGWSSAPPPPPPTYAPTGGDPGWPTPPPPPPPSPVPAFP